MKVREILDKKNEQVKNTVYTVLDSSSAFDAIARLDELKVGSLLVINESEEIIGIISERDILYKCYNSGIPLQERNVKDLMTVKDDLIIGELDDDTKYLRNVMTEKRIRHIPIIDNSNNVVGIISSGDIIKNELEMTESEAHLLREHIKNPFGVHSYKPED